MTWPSLTFPRQLACRDAKGSAAAELTLVTPLVMLVLFLLVAAARLTSAREEVDGAAHQAARAASIERSAGPAAQAAQTTARSVLTAGGVTCQSLTVSADTSGFEPGGTVTVQVSCTVDLADLALLHIPGTRVITTRFSAPIDRYRGVEP